MSSGANRTGYRRRPGWSWVALAGIVSVMPSGAHAQEQQTGRITGRVTDAQSGAPLSDVQVYLVGLNIGAISRQNGAYVMVSVPATKLKL